MVSIASFHLTYLQLFIVALVAIFMGMAKTGVQGVGLLAVPMTAAVFGGISSTGLLLPMMIIADVFGVWYYHRHASWYYFRMMFPWAAVGVLIGVAVGRYVSDEMFRYIMAIIILGSLFTMILLERKTSYKVPDSKAFAITMGIIAGFTSMIGNLAGTVMALYLLSMRLPKNEFVGTLAWFFMMLNLFKVPFHLFVWHTIKAETLLFDLTLLPLIFLGAYIGVRIVKAIPEKGFRWFVIGGTLVAAIYMLR